MEKQKRDILTRELADKSEMIRFVLGPDNKIFVDLSEKLPGRGMWFKANKESLKEVIEKRMFNKACSSDCKVDENFSSEIETLLKKRVLNSISIAKKSGGLTVGFDKTLDFAKKGITSIFLIASDSGEDGKSKIKSHLSESVLIIDCFTGAELQKSLGQDSVVVYAAIKKSSLAKKIKIEFKKMQGFA